MDILDKQARTWLARILGDQFMFEKHIHSHQDEVYKITTPRKSYYLKVSPSLKTERDNLNKLKSYLHVPAVIDFHTVGVNDYLLISELPGKNLVELTDDWSHENIVAIFATAIRNLHTVDVTKVYPGQASPKDVLLHGDMSLPNIIVSNNPGRDQIGYIDFGQMAYGPPDLDLADAIWSLQRNIGPEYGKLFLKIYGPVIITPQIDKALKFRYDS